VATETVATSEKDKETATAMVTAFAILLAKATAKAMALDSVITQGRVAFNEQPTNSKT